MEDLVPKINLDDALERKIFRTPDNHTSLAQHNDLVFSKYSMTELQHNIFLKLLAQFNKEDGKFYLFKIPYSQLVGKGGRNFELVQEAVRKLDATRVEMWIDGEWVRFPLFGLSKANPKNKFIEIKFNEDMRPYLLDLKGKYTLTYYHYMTSIGDVQSRRIYEFLKANEDRQTVTFKLSSLKQWLRLEESYKKFRDFRRWVLEKAQDQLEKTDMAFTFKPIRKGRSVHQIEFIRKKSSMEIPFPVPHDNFVLPAIPTLNSHPLARFSGRDFLESSEEFTKEEIEIILALGKGVYNRRILTIKGEGHYDKIRSYFDDVV